LNPDDFTNDDNRADRPEDANLADQPAATPLPWWSRPVQTTEPAPATPATSATAGPTFETFEAPTDGVGDTAPVYGSAGYAMPGQVPLFGEEPPVAVVASARTHRIRNGLRSGAALTAAAVVLSAAVTGVVVHSVDDSSNHPTAASSSTSVSNLPQTTALSASVKSALAKITPSVVIINDTITTSASGQGGFGGFGGSGGFEASGAGTGIIVTAGGEVVTNAHVVNGATDIKVTLPNNGGQHAATIVGIDTTNDLAVLKVSGVSGLTPATFANSDSVAVGDSVLAVGNALGYGGSPTVTEGIISAKGRSLSDSEDNLSGLLQTDAAINPGNSGGPLVDANGNVVGINVAVATGTTDEPAQNIGFTIPSNTVVKNLPLLEAGENATSGSGGSSGSSGGTTTNGAYLGVEIGDNPGGGAVIEQVEAGSPAATAGLQAGDVITAVNGTTIADGTALQQAIRADKPGTSVTLSVTSSAGNGTVKVKLGSTADENSQAQVPSFQG
jgi:S1-C subfamily serine protease